MVGRGPSPASTSRGTTTFIDFTSAKIASRSGYFELTAPVNSTANGCAASPVPAWRPYMAASTPKGIQWCARATA